MEGERRVSIDLSKNSIRRHERSHSAPVKPRTKLKTSKRTKSDTVYIVKKDDYCVALEWSEEDFKEKNAHTHSPNTKLEFNSIEKSDSCQLDAHLIKKKKKIGLFKRIKNFFKAKS